MEVLIVTDYLREQFALRFHVHFHAFEFKPIVWLPFVILIHFFVNHKLDRFYLGLRIIFNCNYVSVLVLFQDQLVLLLVEEFLECWRQDFIVEKVETKDRLIVLAQIEALNELGHLGWYLSLSLHFLWVKAFVVYFVDFERWESKVLEQERRIEIHQVLNWAFVFLAVALECLNINTCVKLLSKLHKMTDKVAPNIFITRGLVEK